MISFKQTTAAASILLLSTMNSGCNKQPKADFTTDRYDCIVGDVVKVTNESVDAKSYLWTFPGKKTSTQENDEFVVPNIIAEGEMSIILQAFSRKGNKSATVSKRINVKQAWGEATIWTSDPMADNVTVNIENIGYSVLAEFQPYANYPGCNAKGCIKIKFPVGTYDVSAIKGNLTWHGSVTITRDNCLSCELK